ncbi:PREDICTED: baculoviral IAP repeat-containing protein 5 [Vollenhovia emeryi]|uniref:baculoviral IAP repeat-containing protein 5 n=1 Tax=Vollenhovia emeryi TaxID=411798 RepID=UPI0005F522AA|nr:PREDICTED: baculoviral IAP repeat-containing protein 5 [Vollenhovia emeryi]
MSRNSAPKDEKKIIGALPEATAYFWKQNRRSTYDNWPFNDSNKCNAECMAEAGFYVVGGKDEPDLVECFICSKQLNGWEPDDDPWDEHVKHNSDCPFIKFNVRDEKKWTIDQLYDLYKKYKAKEFMDEVKNNIAMIQHEAERFSSQLSVERAQKP